MNKGFGLEDFKDKIAKSKAGLWGLMALLSAILIYGSPIAFGIYLVCNGHILWGIIFPFAFWVLVGIYFAFLPVIWIIGWFQIGFWYSTAYCLALLILFNLPNVFAYLQGRQEEKIMERNYRKELMDSNHEYLK